MKDRVKSFSKLITKKNEIYDITNIESTFRRTKSIHKKLNTISNYDLINTETSTNKIKIRKNNNMSNNIFPDKKKIVHYKKIDYSYVKAKVETGLSEEILKKLLNNNKKINNKETANLHLRSEEFDILEKFYSVHEEEDKVYYKDLVEEVETVFTVKNLEKNPLMRPKEYITPDFINPEKRLTQEEAIFLDKTLKKLALLSIKYRVMPKSFFRDNDRANIGTVPSSRFAAILSFFKLDVNEKEMNIIIKRFYSKNMIEINYYDFDYVLNKYIQMVEEEKEKENAHP